MTGRVLAALLVVALLVSLFGCGKKARPEPRTASLAPVAVCYDIALSR